MDTKLFLLLSLCATPSFAQTDLGSLAWGIHNTGASQQLGIDHYTSGSIAGIPGEDIRLPAPLPTARKVIVAVLDTGVDYNHPQLKDALVGKGYNAINNTTDATDGHGHGTHVSGIIAARLNNLGFQGVSQNAMIMPIKVVQTGPNAPIRPQDVEPGAGTALTETVAKGITYAVQNGAEVINLSLAWPSSIRSQKVDDAIALALQKNVIIVSSAGNDSTTADVYPCIYDNVICVGAQGPDGAFTHFSNYGSMVDVLAPGVAILSTWPLTEFPVTFAGQVGYEFRDGTSMSAPFVTGAIAELLSRGFSPSEAKNRILLGSRTPQTQSLFTSKVQEVYSQDSSTEHKALRFGNLDITGALAVTPSPLILPSKKGIIEVQWDGVSTEITIPINWTNNWLPSTQTTITLNDQTYSFDSMDANSSVTTPYRLTLGDHPNSIIHLNGSVQTAGFSKTNIDVEIELVRILKSTQIPAEAITQTLIGIDPSTYTGIRSIVASDTNPRNDLLFTSMNASGVKISLVQGNTYANTHTFPNLTDDNLLNLYRLPDLSYAAVFTYQDRSLPRPIFYIERFDPAFNYLSETKLGTDTTVLSEGFEWAPFKGGFTPLWISIGYTPPLDQPPYDPWNPTYQDTKMPRIFYLDGQNLRTIALGPNQLPLQILPDGRILVSDGVTYSQDYELITLKDGAIVKQESLVLPNYRMLIGLDPGMSTFNLDGSPSQSLLISGSSSPGDLRVTGIGGTPYDSILMRSTQLDAIVGVIGGYQSASSDTYFFVQTQYNLQLFTAGSMQTYSTSVNRYSYIPSMIFAKSLFPTVVKDQNGVGLPGVYTPASIANANTSEIVFADTKSQSVLRPATLRLRVSDPSCQALGNLIQATQTTPAAEAFICGNNLIQMPITIRR